MITIEKLNIDPETKRRTKEQLKNKVKPEKLHEDDREEILANAPEAKEGAFVVPKTFD